MPKNAYDATANNVTMMIMIIYDLNNDADYEDNADNDDLYFSGVCHRLFQPPTHLLHPQPPTPLVYNSDHQKKMPHKNIKII